MLDSSIWARSTHALDRIKHFATKFDLCFNVMTVESRDNCRSPSGTPLYCAAIMHSLIQRVAGTLIACLVKIGSRSERRSVDSHVIREWMLGREKAFR